MLGTLILPLVVPEIVVAITTRVFFSALGLKLGLLNLVIAHTVFCIPFALMPILARVRQMGDTSTNMLKKFTAETGAKVTLDRFDTNETLLAKLRSGSSGYDITVASTDFIPLMVKQGLIQPVHIADLAGYENLDARWKDTLWDPGNVYSIPWQWGVTSALVDSAVYKGPTDTLKTLFEPPRGSISFMMDPKNAAMELVASGYPTGVKGADAFLTPEVQSVPELKMPAGYQTVVTPTCPEEVTRKYDLIWTRLRQSAAGPAIYYFVGGSSKFYGCNMLQMRVRDFEEVQHLEGVSPAWPIRYADLEPYYTDAKRLYWVHGEAGADVTDPPRTGPYADPPVANDPPVEALRERFRGGGVKPFPQPVSIALPPGGHCIRCIICDGYPCRIAPRGRRRPAHRARPRHRTPRVAHQHVGAPVAAFRRWQAGRWRGGGGGRMKRSTRSELTPPCVQGRCRARTKTFRPGSLSLL